VKITQQLIKNPTTNRPLGPLSTEAAYALSTGTKVDFLGISRDFVHLSGNNGETNEDRPVLSATEW